MSFSIPQYNAVLFVDPTKLVIFNMTCQQQCVECKTSTKYKCINCKVCVCNRPSCSVAEVDEETDGWVENISCTYVSTKAHLDYVHTRSFSSVFTGVKMKTI